MAGSEKYLKYGRPIKPADPDAEYLTVQEVAWVFHCGVGTIRRHLKELQAGEGLGRRSTVSRKERAALDKLRSAPRRTRRKPAGRATAKTPEKAVA